MQTANVTQETNLYFQQGSSDKVYGVSIESVDDGFFVYTNYGRRGRSLTQAKKTMMPVTLKKAQAMHDKLVKSKKAKGYKESDEESNLTSNSIKNDKEDSGIYPQLLNEIDREKALELCRDHSFVAQEKHDGERRMVYCKEGTKGINKKGLFVPLKKSFCDDINLNGAILDGEDMGSHIEIFDVLELNGKDLRAVAFEQRYRMLERHLQENTSIKVSKVAFTREAKLALLDKVELESGEGLVFKKIHAPYISGRPNSGGDQLKYKFYATASVIVEAHNEGKRSVKMSVMDVNGDSVLIGNVTIPVNKPIPAVGSIVEVRYMYFFENGSLFQPVYLCERVDVDADECLKSQLKVKRTDR